ncbi:GAF domain-containing protein [Ensifer sp. ENS09]|uniref:GAF domain-containing protein n=1 Tax=Ensifer sp. ENS09 TaxID=2769263 RepID=UPI001786C87A|nr:GAF domain-containing protein [Ensifer sp. ENS09]MBD9649856.1 GAF domain-containing protein [Ensifer sp. ENS09]
MQRFILRQNIHLYEAKLSTVPTEGERTILEAMLAASHEELVFLEQLWRLSWPELDARPSFVSQIEDILDRAVAAHGADFGSCQIWNDVDGSLALFAQCNFDRQYATKFAHIRDGDGTSCEAAMKGLKAVCIEDLERDIDYPNLHGWARDRGIRSITSIPIMTPAGKGIGVYSLHYRNPHALSSVECLLISAYRPQFAAVFEGILGR